jgi:hypothetical protein
MFGLVVNGLIGVIGAGRIAQAIREDGKATRRTVINVEDNLCERLGEMSRAHAGYTHNTEQALTDVKTAISKALAALPRKRTTKAKADSQAAAS